ncbi:hypothetical protein [Klebsiella phage 05F01]|nr:hypothetical protein [Klebsiella phage 05F01]
MRDKFELYMAGKLGYLVSEIKYARDPFDGYLYAFDVTHPLHCLDSAWRLWKVAYNMGAKDD